VEEEITCIDLSSTYSPDEITPTGNYMIHNIILI